MPTNNPDHWQQAALDALTGHLQADPDVLALAVFGSWLDPDQLDAWSDLDVIIVVSLHAFERFSTDLAWLGGMGTVLGMEHDHNTHNDVIRTVFTNLHALDVILTTDADLAQIETWPRPVFRSRVRVVFSRSEIADEVFARPPDPPDLPHVSDARFAAMVDGFYLRGARAVKKVARGDLLIASHLAFEMAQDCLVLGMILRDRAEGTTIHQTGGEWNEITKNFGAIAAASASDILRLIKRCAHTFDDLAGQWSADYEPRHKQLLALIERAHPTREWE